MSIHLQNELSISRRVSPFRPFSGGANIYTVADVLEQSETDATDAKIQSLSDQIDRAIKFIDQSKELSEQRSAEIQASIVKAQANRAQVKEVLQSSDRLQQEALKNSEEMKKVLEQNELWRRPLSVLTTIFSPFSWIYEWFKKRL